MSDVISNSASFKKIAGNLASTVRNVSFVQQMKRHPPAVSTLLKISDVLCECFGKFDWVTFPLALTNFTVPSVCPSKVIF